MSCIYIYTRKSVIRSTPEKHGTNVDNTDFTTNVGERRSRNERNDFSLTNDLDLSLKKVNHCNS